MGEPRAADPVGSRPPRSAAADRDSRALVQAVFDSALDAVVVIDHEGTVLEFSRSAERVFGYPRSAAVGRRLDELIIPSRFRERHRRGLADAVEGGETPFVGRRMELPAQRASGREFPAEVTVSRLDLGSVPRFVGFIRDITERRRAEHQVMRHKERLRALASELTLAEERERRRIALGLHDRIGHTLAIAKLRLGELCESERNQEEARALGDVMALLNEALQESRSLTFDLSSPVLYELGLEAALRSLGKQIAERNGVEFHFTSDGRTIPLAENCRVILYRAVQELLLNIVKHAGAKNARVAIERGAGEIRIVVEDDGEGFDSGAEKAFGPEGGLGLFGVRERLGHIGGRLTIEAGHPSGTRFCLVAPLECEEGPGT